MAVTYKDIDLLTQKSAVAGTEKLPVSDTEYITPDQIAGLVTVDSSLDRTSENAIENRVVTRSIIHIENKTATSTESGKFLKTDGTENVVSSYSYKKFSVTPGRTYAVSTMLLSGYTAGVIRAVIFLDTNDAVVGYSGFGNSYGSDKEYFNALVVAPSGAVTAAVNYRASYSWAGKLGLLEYDTTAYVGTFSQTLTSDEKSQARTNIGAEASANKVTSLSSSSTDTEYPSAKCVYDIVGDIETLLTALL